MISVTRRYHFSAAHVLARPDWPDADNLRTYGKCANPAGHGHTYGLEVSVAGPLEPESGRVVDLDQLDSVVREVILDRLDHRHLNEDAWFEAVVPTSENLARAVHDALEGPVAALPGASLLGIRLIETRRNHFEYGGRP